MAGTVKTYVANRWLKVHCGVIQAGEAYPAREVIPALIDTGRVSQGSGSPPADVRTHCAFSLAELAQLQVLFPEIAIDPGVRCERCQQVEKEHAERRRLAEDRRLDEERQAQERGRQEKARLQTEADRRERQAALDALIDQELAKKRTKPS